MHVWLNGKILPAEDARIPATDPAVLYGAGLFETFRTIGGRLPPSLPHHLRRLREGCDRLCIVFPDTLTPTTLADATAGLLARNGQSEATVRLTLLAAPASTGLPRGPFAAPHVLLTLRPAPAIPAAPVDVHLLTTRRPLPESAPRLKTTSWVPGILALQELAARAAAPSDHGLMLNETGHLSECVTANLFFFRRGRWHTPGLSCGPLPGITRAWVLRHLQDAAEGAYTPADLREADAVFVCNAGQGLVPVARITEPDGAPLWCDPSAPHPAYRTISDAYMSSLASGACWDA